MPRPSRLRSRLFALAAGVSLVLCIAAGVLWVRSHRDGDGLQRRQPGLNVAINSLRGGVGIQVWRGPCVEYMILNEPAGPTFDFAAAFGLATAEIRSETPQGNLIRPTAPVEVPGGWRYSPHAGDPVVSGDRWWNRLGLGAGTQWTVAGIGSAEVLWLSIPYWPFVAATALPPLLWAELRGRRAWVRRRRTRMGLCPRCGYDLRGSADRCSECGESIATKGAAA